ncbi:MAG TPA: enoyl-CoA hydratase/isomerase family protein [Baekduia sp.]|uniref:enoyl-CoA hydratase/isomerase family protein n=1 Tax=Baekduia sp. TaxID=2600305 RepID=UPI002D797D68|nr:enoyl-CoA hydratase/isomerase family protein [Baekduia sp.]HET6507006.1 enoyl-CoA hydratase/isomerase family protein [Baekduia sp.]
METITIDRRDDGTALVTMNRPDKMNAMSQAFFRELPAALDALDADPGVRACVLTGAGRAFSAGGDIGDFHALDGVADYRLQVKLALECFLAVERAETVVIAAVNGLAFGGGTELTLACDMAFASTQARFAFKEITLGLMPGYGIVRGPDVMGRAWTHRMALTGDVVAAEQALAIGLVQEVSEPDALVGDALALAARIAANPPDAVAVAKRFTNRHAPAGIAESIEATAFLQANPETRERVRTFVSRKG